MLIKLLDNFRGKKPGDVIDWPDPMAQILIDNKRAVIAKGETKVQPKQQEKEIDEPPADKMVRKPVGKKRA